jgi:hypothetical protein
MTHLAEFETTEKEVYEREKATVGAENIALEEDEIENSPIEAVRLGEDILLPLSHRSPSPFKTDPLILSILLTYLLSFLFTRQLFL